MKIYKNGRYVHLQLVDDFLEVVGCAFAGHDLNHLPADSTDLGALSVRRLLDLVLPALGEADAEETQKVAIGGTHINVGIDQSLRK